MPSVPVTAKDSPVDAKTVLAATASIAILTILILLNRPHPQTLVIQAHAVHMLHAMHIMDKLNANVTRDILVMGVYAQLTHVTTVTSMRHVMGLVTIGVVCVTQGIMVMDNNV
uniref:Uncharacterized protein n=1 Tax=Ciona intestinalis TaxID=7719 RepID=F6YSR0_CIOIN